MTHREAISRWDGIVVALVRVALGYHRAFWLTAAHTGTGNAVTWLINKDFPAEAASHPLLAAHLAGQV